MIFVNAKTELLTLRIPSDVKALLEQKARLQDISVNDYVKALIVEDAKKTLREEYMDQEHRNAP